MGFHDGIDRAAFFAHAAKNTFVQGDVVARGAPRTVLAFFRFDGDRQGRTDRIAQIAGNAAFLAVGGAVLSVQPAETRGHGRACVWVTTSNLSQEDGRSPARGRRRRYM